MPCKKVGHFLMIGQEGNVPRPQTINFTFSKPYKSPIIFLIDHFSIFHFGKHNEASAPLATSSGHWRCLLCFPDLFSSVVLDKNEDKDQIKLYSRN